MDRDLEKIQAGRNLAKAVGYKGRKISFHNFKPMSINSYWDSGSRDYFYFVTEHGPYSYEVNQVRQNGTPFDGLNLRAEELKPNQYLIEVSWFQGKCTGCRIYGKNIEE